MKAEDMAEALRMGRQVKRHRQRLGLSMLQLAEKLDVSYQMVQKYEAGKVRLSSPRIRRLVEIFGISYAKFLGDSAPVPVGEPPTEVSGRALGKQEERLLAAFNHLTEKSQRKVVIDLVEIMAFKGDHSS